MTACSAARTRRLLARLRSGSMGVKVIVSSPDILAVNEWSI